MDTNQRKFHLDVLTPEGAAVSVDAVSLIVPAIDGQLGVLGGHAPLLAMLGAGPMTVTDESRRRHRYFVAGGFVHVLADSVSVLADQCIPVEQLERGRAIAELDEAQRMEAPNEEAGVRRRDAVVAAKAKLAMARKPAAEGL